jgi:hypothetical protein
LLAPFGLAFIAAALIIAKINPMLHREIYPPNEIPNVWDQAVDHYKGKISGLWVAASASVLAGLYILQAFSASRTYSECILMPDLFRKQ